MSKTLTKALNILEALSVGTGETSLSELSQALDIHPSTLYRLLNSLAERGYVRRDAQTRRYALGFALARLGNAVSLQPRLVEACRPVLDRLVKDVGETANLGVRYQDKVVYVDQVECTATVRAFTQVGAEVPLHCTGLGKAILAYSSDEAVERYIGQSGLRAYSSHTITQPYVLKEELEKVRAAGFAVDDQERELGTRCVAAPVRDSSGNVSAAISVSAPARRLEPGKWNAVGSRVKAAAAEVSRSVGFVGDDDRSAV